MPKSSSHPRVLLVEGGTDQDLVHGFCKVFNKSNSHCQIPTDFEIVNMEGAPNIFKHFVSQLKVSRRKAVGVIIDADGDACDRWDCIKSELIDLINEFGLAFPIPDKPLQGGTIIGFPKKDSSCWCVDYARQWIERSAGRFCRPHDQGRR